MEQQFTWATGTEFIPTTTEFIPTTTEFIPTTTDITLPTLGPEVLLLKPNTGPSV
jgi:hypothetical protein